MTYDDTTTARTAVLCQVASTERLSGNVMRLWLNGPASLRYLPGQYLEICVEVEGRARWLPFSIANACRHDGQLELHIHFQPGSPGLAALAELIDGHADINVRLPSGDCVLAEDDHRPLLLIAASTGMAQMKAIAEAALERDPARHVDIWWGGRTAADLYLHDALKEWERRHPGLSYRPVIEDGGGHDLGGIAARIDEALRQHITGHRHYSIFLSGSPGMVYSVIDSLGVVEPLTERVFSDVFRYAPRK